VLKDAGVPNALIGGVAASLIGRPRTTADVDALVWLEDEASWAPLVKQLGAGGIRPRRKDALAFAHATRVLLLRHAATGINIDLSLAALPFERETIERSKARKIGSIRVPVPTPEDLIIMKAIAHRPHDIGDIEGILATHPKLDRVRIEKWVAAFADFLASPELLATVKRLLSQPRVPSARRRKR
jgi:hypothetical protein